MELFFAILETLKGQQISAVFSFVVIFAILFLCGFFITKYMKSALLKAPDYVPGRNVGGSLSAKNSSSGEEWFKSEEGTKYIKDFINIQIKLDDERIEEKLVKNIQSHIKIHSFEESKKIYESISKMREEYAGNYVTKKDLDRVIEDLDNVRIELAKVKGHFNIQ